MRLSKLTDEDILRYLDGDLLPDERASVEKTLLKDDNGRRRLAAFRDVYAITKSAELPPVVPGFVDAVMTRLPRERPAWVRWLIRLDPVCVFASLALLTGLLLFVDFSAIGRLLQSITIPALPEMPNVSAAAEPYVTRLEGSLPLIAGSAVALVFFGLLDRLLLRARPRRPHHINMV